MSVFYDNMDKHKEHFFATVDYSKSSFVGSNLAYAVAQDCRFQGSNFLHAGCCGANFEGADLRDTILTAADFTGASLAGANITGALIERVDWSYADLEGLIVAPGAYLVGTRPIRAVTFTGVEQQEIYGFRTNAGFRVRYATFTGGVEAFLSDYVAYSREELHEEYRRAVKFLEETLYA